MAVFKNVSIKLDSPQSVFYPGQVITGSLEIEIEAPLTFSVIYVKFLGEATVNLKEESQYVNREEYFRDSQLLTGSYGSLINLNPGKYNYNFQYLLPRGIPSSFAGDWGCVEYSVVGHVDFQTQPLLKEIKHFDVVAPFDLNKGNACAREPIELEFEEVYGCGCFCSSDPVSVRVRLPVSAYCPGQAIPVAVAVENGSSVEISSMIFELLTRKRYRSQRPVAEYVPPGEVIGTVTKGSIMSGTTRNFTLDLVVPSFIAPNLEDCSIIDVGYFFRVTIKLSGCNDDLQDEAEICLGLIPLQETVQGSYVHPMAERLPAGPVPPLAPGDVFAEKHVRKDTTPMQTGPTVPEGTSYFVQVSRQVISSDPSQNYQMGFKASYPPGSEVPPFDQRSGELNGQQWSSAFETDMRIQMENLMPHQNVDISFGPRGKSPAPSAPPL